MAVSDERLRSIVESLLLISPEPVPVARLIEVIRIEDPQTEDEEVKRAVSDLIERYGDPDRAVARGFRIDELATGLQLRTVAENAQYVRRFLAARPQRLSKASLETLSIIAYRQPVTKPEIEGIRGVDVGAALKNLLERDLIRILGKREEIGRPLIYGTTKFFLEFFGLRSLAELPTLREYHELDEEHAREVEALERPSMTELRAVADFLAERQHDPDLDELDRAVSAVDRVRRAAAEVLGTAAEDAPEAPVEGAAPEPESGGESHG